MSVLETFVLVSVLETFVLVGVYQCHGASVMSQLILTLCLDFGCLSRFVQQEQDALFLINQKNYCLLHHLHLPGRFHCHPSPWKIKFNWLISYTLFPLVNHDFKQELSVNQIYTPTVAFVTGKIHFTVKKCTWLHCGWTFMCHSQLHSSYLSYVSSCILFLWECKRSSSHKILHLSIWQTSIRGNGSGNANITLKDRAMSSIKQTYH